jgi:hypothetical protein
LILDFSGAANVFMGAGPSATFANLITAVGDVCDLFNERECSNFFKAAGYV